MKRIVLIVTTIFALFALSVPSGAMALGVTAPQWHRAPVASGASATIVYSGCKVLGGKRVLPCHPDLGVLTRIAVAALPCAVPCAERGTLPSVASLVPEIELPPPRLG